MGALQNVFAFAVFLGVLVTVHELGHFLVAKACGVKVLKFSIGFGPRIFGFTRGETEYRVAWLPLGGYVKMAGEQPEDEVNPDDAKRSFLNQPWWKRALIVIAGPVFNLTFPVILFFFVFLGDTQVAAPRVGWVEPELPAARAGLKPGDKILTIDDKPVRAFNEIRELVADASDREVKIELERKGEKIVTRLTPFRSTENTPIEKVTRGLLGIWPRGRAPVVGVAPGSVAERAGLATFDRILKVDGAAVKDEEELAAAVAKAQETVKLTVVRSELIPSGGTSVVVPEVKELEVPKQPGEGFAAIGAEKGDLYVWAVAPDSPVAKAGLSRGDRLLQVDGKPLSSWLSVELALQNKEKEPFKLTWRGKDGEQTQQVSQATVVIEDELKTRIERIELGLLPRPMYRGAVEPLTGGPVEEMTTVHMGVSEAALAAVKNVPEMIRKIGLIFVRLFTGKVPLDAVGGPIMLFQVASKSAEAGLGPFVEAMALVSINLGLVNLLPIPVLDGFGLLAALWEGIRRRPIPIKAREYANLVGLAMLAVLVVMVFKNDITRLLR